MTDRAGEEAKCKPDRHVYVLPPSWCLCGRSQLTTQGASRANLNTVKDLLTRLRAVEGERDRLGRERDELREESSDLRTKLAQAEQRVATLERAVAHYAIPDAWTARVFDKYSGQEWCFDWDGDLGDNPWTIAALALTPPPPPDPGPHPLDGFNLEPRGL